jgi:hypothetical protein
MQAGRALALDPELVEAGQLITQLIVEPPKDVPPEVEADLSRDAAEYTRAVSRGSLVAQVTYLAVIPSLIAMASIPYTIVLLAATAGAFTFIVLAARSGARVHQWTILAFSVVLMFVLGRMYTPVLVNVGFGVLLCWALLANPMLRSRTASLIGFTVILAAALAPLVAERVGWVSPTIIWQPDGISLRGLAMKDSKWMLDLMVTSYVVIMIGIAAVIGHHTRTTTQELRTKFYVQAWQIRHLMPEQRRR